MSNFIFTNQFYNDDKGRTLPKARLHFYDNNTFNFTDVYSDPELTQVLDNPVTADGAGRFPQIFIDTSKVYRVWLKDRNDVQVTPYIDDYTPLIVAADVNGVSIDTLQDAMASDFKVGRIVNTTGYHTVNDGGAGQYIVVGNATGTDDGGSYLDMVNGNQLELIDSGIIKPEMFGGIRGDSASYKDAIDRAQDYCASTGLYTLSMDGGVYPCDKFTLKKDIKLLGLNGGLIEFTSNVSPMIELEGGVEHSSTEFHGKLTCTEVVASKASGLFVVNSNNTIINKADFSGMQFENPNSGVNGVLFVAGNSGKTNRSWFKNLSFENCRYINCGRMGIEVLNQISAPTISNITIGADAVFTVNEVFAEDGRTVLIEEVVGSGAVDDINGQYFKFFNVDDIAGTFQLQKSDGTLYDTTGGAYTSGGVVRVVRVENLSLKGSVFEKTGSVGASTGMGFSGDRNHLNTNISNCVFKDTIQFGIELVGMFGSIIENNEFIDCTGDPISTSNAMGYDNKISKNNSSGFADGRVFISKQKRLSWVGNTLKANDSHTFTEVSDSEFYGGRITSIDVYAGIFDNSPDNYIHDIVFDNSLSSSNFSTFRFVNSGSTGNLAKNFTVLKGSGGVHVDESSGAASNIFRDYRQAETGDFVKGVTVQDSYAAFGLASTYNRLPYTQTYETNNYSGGSGYTNYRVKLLILSGAQPHALAKILWSGRNNNTPLGGEITLAFRTTSDYDATPVFWQGGSAVTLETVQFDGSGYPYWDITLPTNNGSLFSKVQAVLRNSSDAALCEITLIT